MKVCPKCKSKKITETLYGLIREPDEKLQKEIDDERIEIIPKDTKANPINSLKVSKELYAQGVRIVIGPLFNESVKYLDDLKDVTFLSFTNKIKGNPSNVISAGVNAISPVSYKHLTLPKILLL